MHSLEEVTEDAEAVSETRFWFWLAFCSGIAVGLGIGGLMIIGRMHGIV